MNVQIHFDFISPYAYLAWTQIHAVAARHGATVEPIPVLFAGLLQHHGTKGPAEIPAKRAYLFKDIVRIAHSFGVPIAAPASHPFNPLLPLRAASLDLEPDLRKRLIDALYAATWAETRRVDTQEVVFEVARSVGLAGEELVARATSEEAKNKLRSNTERAIERGVFGVPTMMAGPVGAETEMFWGTDSLAHLETFLRGEDPVAGLSGEKRAAFFDIPSTARRRL
ncbi:MAG: DsbA family protein [Polyangiales bacterium]